MTPSSATLRDTATASRTRLIRRQAAPRGVRIAGLALHDGPTSYTQEEVLARLDLVGDESAERVFSRSGVKRRYLNLSSDFLASTLQARSPAVEAQLLEHSVAAIDALAPDTSAIGTVLSSSLYALGCPSLAHQLVEHYRLDPATDKYHIAGVGCASAVPMMRLGAQCLASHPRRTVLVVAAESMSSTLVPAREGDPKAKTVGSAIFGDGCAAALLSDAPGVSGPQILATHVHQVSDSLGAVSLAFSEQEGYLHLARDLPEVAAYALAPVVDRFLASHSVSRNAIDHWIVHPGGRRIIEGVQTALDLSDADAETSWHSLAEHGNVGTPSIFYVLAATHEQRAPQPGEHGLCVTIGPGVTIGLMLLRW